jgi:hypothetical protein
MDTRGDKHIRGNPNLAAHMDRLSGDIESWLGIVVVARAKIGTLRNYGMRPDMNFTQRIKHHFITDPGIVRL